MMVSDHLMIPKGGRNRGLVELNYNVQDEPKEVRVGVAGEGQGLSEEDESGINEVSKGMNDGRGGGVDPPVHQADVHNPQAQPWTRQQQQQQPPPGPVVQWEKFLPFRSLKVLLVENDDSTRQVVSALLRNCSYEVTAASNGVEAWKILEDLTNQVDIVLTEVAMPCLSGIGLLCKIMNHKTCKNIPVIMMSSLDSMGIVFKCLSKGAADFLVKPVRKNELKNLWQHVWRRCHSSSGSGSESGIQTQKSVKSKSVDKVDNNTGSNDEDDNGSIGLNTKDGSDNGSGTQSSWTRREAEPDSPQSLSPWDRFADPHDSTCAQFIYPKPETFCNDWAPMTGTKGWQEQKELLDDDCMGKDLEIGVPRNPDIQLESNPSERLSTNLTSTVMDNLSENDPKKDNQQQNESLLDLDGFNATGKLSTQAADLIGTITNSTEAQIITTSTKASYALPKISEDKDKVIADVKELPSLELSLKRLRSIGNEGIGTNDDRNVLRHSDLSAFSRYNTSTASTQAPTGFGGSRSAPLDNSLDAVKMESTYNIQFNLNATPLNQGSNGSSNNDMGSTTKNVFTKPAAFTEKVASTSTVKGLHPASAFHPLQHRNCATQAVMQDKIDYVAATALVEQSRATHRQLQVQHHYHHHHYVHSMQQQLQQPSDHDELSLENMAAAATPCGSSNVLGGPMEVNAVNYSLNKSISGSNHGSNGQNGSSTSMNSGIMNMESDNGLVGKGGEGGCNAGGRGSGVDHNRFAQREAALTKFRQKRKERCFQKKVRYQSRKRLAEQRPRVRGQFVRQIIHGHTSYDADC